MQYMLMIFSDETGWSSMSEAEQKQAMAAYGAYGEALRKAGALKESNRLRPTATDDLEEKQAIQT